MDKRNSKTNLIRKIQSLETRLEAVYTAGMHGIAHVGRANYASRERDAVNHLERAMYGEEAIEYE